MEKGPPTMEIPAPPYPGPPLGASQAQPTIQTVHPPAHQPAYQYSAQQPQVVLPVPQPAYQYSAQQPQVVNPVNPVVVVQHLPTDGPGQMMCPHCKTSVVTRIEYKNGMLTWLICGIVGLFLFWPCCFIPFCVNACKDVEHYCPTCNNVLHIYKRM